MRIQTVTLGVLALFAFAPLAQAEQGVPMLTSVDVQVGQVRVTETSSVGRGGDDADKEEDDAVSTTDDGTRGDGEGERERNENVEREQAETPTLYGESDDVDDAFDHVQFRMEEKELKRNEDEDPTIGAEVMMEVRAAKNVRTEEEFKTFVRTKAREDESLKQVEVADGVVNVEYDEPAEFLGFINTKITTRVSVNKEGDVAVAYPWYHIFMKKHAARESIQSDIARALATQNKMEKEGMASTTVTASTTQATIAAGLGIPNIFEIIANSLRSARIAGEATME